MKKTVFALAFLTVLPAFAGSRLTVAQTRDLSERVNETVQAQAERLSDKKLQQIQGLLLKVEALAKDLHETNEPAPAPAKRILVAGNIEDLSYSFVVTNLNELYDQCTALVQSKDIVADDITVGIDFGAARVLRNNLGYWKSPDQICGQIVQVARGGGVKANVKEGTTILGQIEELPFKFSGRDLIDVNQQCTDFVNAQGSLAADDISLSVDFGDAKVLRNNVSYWRGAEICQQILQAAKTSR